MTNSTPLSARHTPSADLRTRGDDEETLVTDNRAALTPSQHVEQKLIGMLKSSSIMLSQVQRRMKPGPR
jgi:hypothetical protein